MLEFGAVLDVYPEEAAGVWRLPAASRAFSEGYGLVGSPDSRVREFDGDGLSSGCIAAATGGSYAAVGYGKGCGVRS